MTANTYRPLLVESEFGNLQVWDEPRVDTRYVVGVDTAEGKVRDRAATQRTSLAYRDDRPDYSAAIAVEIETGKHVASWHGHIPVTDYTNVVAAMGYYYNTALIVPEINGPGLELVMGLGKRVRYPNLYRSRQINHIDSDPFADQWGWRTTQQNRPMLIARVEEMLSTGQVWTRDRALIREMQTMVIDEGGVARAKHPNKDDRVLALGMALQGRWDLLNGSVAGYGRIRDPLEHLSPEDRRMYRLMEKMDGQRGSAGSRRSAGGGFSVTDNRPLGWR